MASESIEKHPDHLDDEARDLYLRYGARAWADLPETTRAHFRGLVRDHLDGEGKPLGPDPGPEGY